MRSQFTHLVLALIALFCLVGCTNSAEPTPTLPPADSPTLPPPPTGTPTPLPTKRPTRPPNTATPTLDNTTLITLVSGDGHQIKGYVALPAEGEDKHIGLVLSHGCQETCHLWGPLVGEFTKLGYTVIAFDHRGWGATGGEEVYDFIAEDVRAAIQYLEDTGLSRVVCMGSSMGGTACLETALTYDLTGLVLLSSPMNVWASGIFNFNDLAKITAPKLLFVAENDYMGISMPDSVAQTFKMYDLLPEPKQVFIDPGWNHGISLLTRPSGVEPREVLMGFLISLVE